MEIYRLTDGNVDCWVYAKDEKEALGLNLGEDYFDSENEGFEIKVIKMKNDESIFLDIGHKRLKHTVFEWKEIFRGTDKHVIAFSEY